jgi:hypothetical protein
MAPNSALSITQRARSKVFIRALLITLVVVLPLLMLLIMVRLTAQTNLSGAVPWLSDGVMNWHQVKTVHTVGFSGGYYTLNEIPAQVDVLRFYMHGPVYPLLYGLFALVAGWDLPIVVYVNIVLFAVGVLVVVRTIPFTNRQLALLALVTGSYSSLILFLPTGMQETLNVFIALVLAALFYRALYGPAQLTRGAKIVGVAFFAFAIFTRMSWGLLLLPYLYLILPPSRVRIPLAVLGTALIGGSLVAIMGRIIPANDYHMVYRLLTALRQDLSRGWSLILENIQINFTRYISPRKPQADIGFTIGFWVVILMLVGLLGQKRSARTTLSPRLETVFHLYNLFSVLIISFVLYIVGTWGDYRVISLHLLLTLVLLIAAGHSRVVTIYLVLNLIFVPLFQSSLLELHEARFVPAERAAMVPLDPYLVFEPDQTNHWCNSITVQEILFDSRLLTVPAGIGLNLIQSGVFTDLSILRSRYLWLAPDEYEQMRNDLGVAELPLAVPAELNLPIYLNPNADC